jgi:hypothetical protein
VIGDCGTVEWAVGWRFIRFQLPFERKYLIRHQQ